jgi:hypothetical protein
LYSDQAVEPYFAVRLHSPGAICLTICLLPSSLCTSFLLLV